MKTSNMDYEKKYKEAIERLKQWDREHPDGYVISDRDEFIFPELAESKDEKIRKAIIEFFESEDDNTTYSLVPKKDIIAWLEKQGEHKDIHADAVLDSNKDGLIADTIRLKPKFKVGDWIVDNNVKTPFQITDISNEKYDIISIYGGDMVFSSNEAERFYHLWTIQDAMDGDILASDNGVCIFDGILEEGKYPFAYCGITKIRGFESYNGGLPFSHDNNIHPATKEQRDTLMKAMTDAGYTFDFEKKELKKIEQKPECSEDNWSEEDEKMLEDIVSSINHESVIEGLKCRGINYSLDTSARLMENLINWLKSLKDRVQPQPQQQWKPTEEQMDALLYIFRHYAPTTTDKLAWDALQTLEFMLAQLKKLKG